MTYKEQIIERIAKSDDSQLLHEILAFLEQREKEEPNRPPKGSYEALMQFAGTISDEEAEEMHDIINREFNNIKGEW